MVPTSLTPRARLELEPGSTPRSCIPVVFVHRNAWVPCGPVEYPTPTPVLLIAIASLDVSPGKVPRSRTAPAFVHRTARCPAGLPDVHRAVLWTKAGAVR